MRRLLERFGIDGIRSIMSPRVTFPGGGSLNFAWRSSHLVGRRFNVLCDRGCKAALRELALERMDGVLDYG